MLRRPRNIKLFGITSSIFDRLLQKITFPTSPVNSHACLVLIILIFQLIETIVLMPEMTTINEMVLVTDLHPDEVMGKYLNN